MTSSGVIHPGSEIVLRQNLLQIRNLVDEILCSDAIDLSYIYWSTYCVQPYTTLHTHTHALACSHTHTYTHTHNTQHTTHNTQHTTHNTQHTTHNTQHTTHTQIYCELVNVLFHQPKRYTPGIKLPSAGYFDTLSTCNMMLYNKNIT